MLLLVGEAHVGADERAHRSLRRLTSRCFAQTLMDMLGNLGCDSSFQLRTAGKVAVQRIRRKIQRVGQRPQGQLLHAVARKLFHGSGEDAGPIGLGWKYHVTKVPDTHRSGKVYTVHIAQDVHRISCTEGGAQEMAERKSVVVTGASTGIGYAIAAALGKRGIEVFGSVRKQPDGERLQRELGKTFTPLVMDVTDDEAVKAAAALVAEKLGRSTLFGLVNNAGIAGGGPLLHQPIEDFRQTLDVNLLGPFRVTQAFARLLGADRARVGKPGRIVQISSVGGKLAFPFLGSYVASKFALEGMSESLRRELLLYGIDVIIVGPGSVKTPMFDKAQQIDLSPYMATDYGPILKGFVEYFINESKKGLPASRIGETVYKALTVSKPHVRYAVVPQRLKNWTLPRALPKRMLDRMIGKQSGLLR